MTPRSIGEVRDVPPFGGYDDPDVRRAYDWFQEFLEQADWNDRVAAIEGAIEEVIEPRASREEAQDHRPLSIDADRMGWYLYLVHTALDDPLKYEPIQGSRVLPIFKRLGADLNLVTTIGGVEDRIARMFGSERDQPDAALFELLIALLWRRNGYDSVEFIPEWSDSKTPDFKARRENDEWFVECKRLRKSSDYSEKERTKWLAMWTKFRDYLLQTGFSVVFEFTFHVELESLPDDFLVESLSGKLPLVQLPCQIVSNDTWDVSARTVDYEAIRAHLAKYRVRYPSDQLNELIGGYRDPNRGFTAVVGGRIVRLGDTGGHNRFLDELAFAAGAYWHCDAERAIQRKARDVRGRLADALEQLPTNAKSAVHVGLETLDGAEVEEERFLRILWSVLSFDAKGKDLRWIYCHLFQSYAPPDDAWVIDETVHNFGSINTEGDEPLNFRSAILPADADHVDGVHWNRPAP